MTLDATRNRSGHATSGESIEDGPDELQSVPTTAQRVDPGPTDAASATLDSTLSGKESPTDAFNTHRESREVNRQEVLPDGIIHHTLTEKQFHETADGRTVHHHERHEIYREVRYGEDAGDANESFSGYGFSGEESPFSKEEGGETEESEDDDEDSYSSEEPEEFDYQTYYSETPPSADQLAEKAVRNEAFDVSGSIASTIGDVDEAETVASAEERLSTSAPGGAPASTSYPPSYDMPLSYSSSTSSSNPAVGIPEISADCYYSSSDFSDEFTSDGLFSTVSPIIVESSLPASISETLSATEEGAPSNVLSTAAPSSYSSSSTASDSETSSESYYSSSSYSAESESPISSTLLLTTAAPMMTDLSSLHLAA